MTHVDGVRDDQNPCAVFQNGTPSGDCESDGHYVCQDCKHLKRTKTHAFVRAAEDAANDYELERGLR